jgi:hypothetical protein
VLGQVLIVWGEDSGFDQMMFVDSDTGAASFIQGNLAQEGLLSVNHQ